MATIVVLGAGVSGHTAALTLRKKLGKAHEVVVVSANSQYQWIPSNIWVGIGRMKSRQVTFPLAPVYQRMQVTFQQARALALYPEGDATSDQPYVSIERTAEGRQGETDRVPYDYLINATGPKLKFEATEGLAREAGNCNSVCTYQHAEHTWENLQEVFRK